MSEGHQSKLLRTDPYKTKQKNGLLPCTGKQWKKQKGKKSKKQKRMFLGTENKIKDIMPTNTH